MDIVHTDSEIEQNLSEDEGSDGNKPSTDPQSSDATENESGSETRDVDDPWIPLIEVAKQRNAVAYDELKQSFIDSGFDDESARDKSCSLIQPQLQKELENVYLERLLWLRELRRDPVHRKIMKTRDDFVENDDFDPEEALEAVVEKRKFVLKRLLKDSKFSEDGENNSDNEN